MSQNYGVEFSAGDTLGTPPIAVDSEIPAIFGAFPADNGTSDEIGHSLEWYRVTSWTEFKAQYGDITTWGTMNRSDGWNAYKTCEHLLKDSNVYPVLIYNVLDPTSHKTDITDEVVTFTAFDSEQDLAQSFIQMSTIVVTHTTGSPVYVLDTDYSLERNTSGIVEIKAISTGSIGATDSVHVDYSYCVNTGILQTEVTAAIESTPTILTTSGLGFNNIPGWLIAPWWTKKDIGSVVAATTRSDLETQAKALMTVFLGRYAYDIDETAYTASNTLVNITADKTHTSEYGRAFFGEGTTASKTEQLHSDWYIAEMCRKVKSNGYPGVTPSNTYMSGFTPNNILGWPTFANNVRDSGIICVSLDTSSTDRYVHWGDKTPYYNGTATDLGKDTTNQNDVIVYLSKLITRDVWARYTDQPYSANSIQSYVDAQNAIGQNLISTGKMIGWQMQFLEEDNPTPSVFLKFRLAILAPISQTWTKFEVQVDLTALDSIFPS